MHIVYRRYLMVVYSLHSGMHISVLDKKNSIGAK